VILIKTSLSRKKIEKKTSKLDDIDNKPKNLKIDLKVEHSLVYL